MIAAIFAAAMSASAGRAERARHGDDHRLLPAALRHGRAPTRTICACRSWRRSSGGCSRASWRCTPPNQGSLIEVVNRYGSFFYGSLLGVFILAILTKRATAAGAFWGLIAGMVVVLIVAFTTPIAFLWHNLIGAVVVFVVGHGDQRRVARVRRSRSALSSSDSRSRASAQACELLQPDSAAEGAMKLIGSLLIVFGWWRCSSAGSVTRNARRSSTSGRSRRRLRRAKTIPLSPIVGIAAIATRDRARRRRDRDAV